MAPFLFVSGIVFAYFVMMPRRDRPRSALQRGAGFAVSRIHARFPFYQPLVLTSIARIQHPLPDPIGDPRDHPASASPTPTADHHQPPLRSPQVIAVLAILLPGTDPISGDLNGAAGLPVLEGSLLLAGSSARQGPEIQAGAVGAAGARAPRAPVPRPGGVRPRLPPVFTDLQAPAAAAHHQGGHSISRSCSPSAWSASASAATPPGGSRTSPAAAAAPTRLRGRDRRRRGEGRGEPKEPRRSWSSWPSTSSRGNPARRRRGHGPDDRHQRRR